MSHKRQSAPGESGAIYETRPMDVRIIRIVRSQRGFQAVSLRGDHRFFINTDGQSLSALRTGDIVVVQLKARVVYEEAVFAPVPLIRMAKGGASQNLGLGHLV